MITLSFCQQAAAQKVTLVSGDFSNYSFPQFVAEMEIRSGYHFYYDAAEMDSFPVNIKADQETVAQLLDRLFEKTLYHYAIE